MAAHIQMAIGLVGPGKVGQALLEEIHVERPNLLRKYRIDLQVLGITNSSEMILGSPLDLSSWQKQLVEQPTDASLGVLTEHLKQSRIPNKVVIDCTASAHVPKFYHKWIEQGIHVVTPNKRLNSGPLDEYLKVKQLQSESKAHYMYEGTVGAGLPIISTLKTLLDSGDDVLRIEGIFSGTLSFIFNNLSLEKPFSECVSGAFRRGYTEPDPRDDLTGMDVTRKIITLARECGAKVELSSVKTENLVPEQLSKIADAAEFMEALPQALRQADEQMDKRVREADARGEVLRYVGTYDAESGVCQVNLRPFPKSSPFAQLSGTECIISFTTTRYSMPPLIVRGPGAGPPVTAAGVFGDLITLARYCGAPS